MMDVCQDVDGSLENLVQKWILSVKLHGYLLFISRSVL